MEAEKLVQLYVLVAQVAAHQTFAGPHSPCPTAWSWLGEVAAAIVIYFLEAATEGILRELRGSQ
jgi:hypothetical protein